MDPLTHTLALLRPRGLLWKQMDAKGEWAVRFPGHADAVFCLVAAGCCVLQVSGREPRVLEEGDFLLMTGPPAWTLGDSEATPPMDYPDRVHPGPDARATYAGAGRAGPVTRVLGGRFVFDDTNATLLQGVLPAIVEIPSSEAGAARLRGVLGLIGDEASSSRPGQTLVLERLLEVMLVEVIRHGAARPVEGWQGLVAGLADARIAATLRALHADPGRNWSVAALAAIAGMSRSVFAERFSRTVGVSPVSYLLRWRMALAKDLLRRGGGSLADVALACGYKSASAFSVAFSRMVGCSPSKYRFPAP